MAVPIPRMVFATMRTEILLAVQAMIAPTIEKARPTKKKYRRPRVSESDPVSIVRPPEQGYSSRRDLTRYWPDHSNVDGYDNHRPCVVGIRTCDLFNSAAQSEPAPILRTNVLIDIGEYTRQKIEGALPGTPCEPESAAFPQVSWV